MLKEVLTEPVIISIVTSATSIVVMLIKHRATRNLIIELEHKLDECVKGKAMLVEILVEHSLITRERAGEIWNTKQRSRVDR